jgi:hypothetical protein
MSKEFDTLLINIKSKPRFFVSDGFQNTINRVVSSLFPNLNINDLNILQIIGGYVIDIISFKYNFSKNSDYYNQWTQNNFRDIKGVILLLLPYINDRDNGYLLNKLTDLNHILYSKSQNGIPEHMLDTDRQDILENYFEYGNMGLGLIPNKKQGKYLLDLNPNGEKLIYKIIHHNLIGLLQTLDIMNGKNYINWVNIVPLNLDNYNSSIIFNNTVSRLGNIKNIFINSSTQDNKRYFNDLLANNLINYNGLWFGEFYNILRNKYYEDVKNIKWLFFPYETTDQSIYLIQGLNKMLDLNKIINSNTNDFNELSDNDQTIFIKSFNNLVNNFKLNIPFNKINLIDFEIIKYLLVYFVNNYSLRKNLSDDIFNKFKLEQEEEELTDDFNKTNFNKISFFFECLTFSSVSIIFIIFKNIFKIMSYSSMIN